MAASFDDISTISANTAFQSRCQYALIVAAIDVMSEANTTGGHAQRLEYAKQVLQAQVSLVVVAMAVLTNATIGAEAVAATTPGYAIPDSDIQFAVNSIFNALSGIGS